VYEKCSFLVKTCRTWGILETCFRDMGVYGENWESLVNPDEYPEK
jgi:hypothetical protein